MWLDQKMDIERFLFFKIEVRVSFCFVDFFWEEELQGLSQDFCFEGVWVVCFRFWYIWWFIRLFCIRSFGYGFNLLGCWGKTQSFGRVFRVVGCLQQLKQGMVQQEWFKQIGSISLLVFGQFRVLQSQVVVSFYLKFLVDVRSLIFVFFVGLREGREAGGGLDTFQWYSGVGQGVVSLYWVSLFLF